MPLYPCRLQEKPQALSNKVLVMTEKHSVEEVPSWQRLRRAAARRAARGGLEEAAQLLRTAAAEACAQREEDVAALLECEALAAAGDLAAALWGLEQLWQRRPGDLAVLHRLCSARRALAQGDWRPGPCAVHVVARCGAYRELAAQLPESTDIVLEIGCAQGYATQILASVAYLVVAMDKSQEMIDAARERLAGFDNVRLLCCDASDPTWPGVHVGRADLVFLDVAGSAPLWQALAMTRDYRDLYLPRAVVVRNVELADLIGAVASWDGGPEGEWRKPPIPHLTWPWCGSGER